MKLQGLIPFFVTLVFVPGQIVCQSSSYETCQVWGDPHLLMFPVHQSQRDMRAIYWCQSTGRMLILKNKYIEVSIDVTSLPYYNENYEIKLFNGPTTFCTITHQNPTCNHNFVKVVQIGGTMSIDFDEADLLNIVIMSYEVNGRNVYNIMITQSYELILQSSGLCITKQPACALENAINPFGRRRKRNLDENLAKLICNRYMEEAYKIAEFVMGNRGSKMAEHARAACIDDLLLTDDSAWGESAIGFVVMDAMQQAQLRGPERVERLKRAVPAINEIASRLRGRCGPIHLNGTFTDIEIPRCLV